MIIAFGNFKGGVGKTTTTSLFGYILSEIKQNKVLLVDTDQQGDLTDEIENTYQTKISRDKNLFNACFKDVEIKDQIQNVTHQLDILAGNTEMRNFSDTTKSIYNLKEEEAFHHKIIALTLNEVIDDYDYILLDTNPSVDLLTENVMYASDYVLIPTKSLARDSEDTKIFYNYLMEYTEEYDFKLLGIIAYLVENSSTDRKILENYKNEFESILFNNVIKNSAVVKRWSLEGITTNQSYDKITLKMYEAVINEALERIGV